MMADKDKSDKRVDKVNKGQKNFFQKVGAFAASIGKKLKNFFISLKAELKRVVWPDRKRLIQNTATVLAICILAGLILFIVDSVLGGILTGVGFYSTGSTTAATTAATTVASTETTTGTTSATTAATTTAGTTASK